MQLSQHRQTAQGETSVVRITATLTPGESTVVSLGRRQECDMSLPQFLGQFVQGDRQPNRHVLQVIHGVVDGQIGSGE